MWKPTLLTPFQNGLGLVVEQEDGMFKRVSRAPILPFDNDDYLSIGLSSVFIEDGLIRLYYTSFLRWGKAPKRQNIIMHNMFTNRRKVLLDELDKVQHSYFNALDVSFYIFIDITEVVNNSIDFTFCLLKEKQVAVLPGIAYGDAFDNYIR